jgi:exodeoxyribonuclease VII small subunit
MNNDATSADGHSPFEEAQAELEEIVRTLERGETSLDRTLELWERGEKLYAICAARLDAAHGRVEELTREIEAERNADGESPASDDDGESENVPSDQDG